MSGVLREIIYLQGVILTAGENYSTDNIHACDGLLMTLLLNLQYTAQLFFGIYRRRTSAAAAKASILIQQAARRTSSHMR